MELYSLHVFLTVATERSFSRAAGRLARTQPAVSLSLQRLEQELGEKLIDRSGKDLILTDAGRTVLEYARRFQSLHQELDNSLARALQQLAIPPQIPISQTTTSIVQLLNWSEASEPPDNVPGLCAGNYINIAVESLAYLQLTAGVHRFHIRSDDRTGLYSGVNLADPNAQALWENPDNTANTTFDFAVEADGLYPIRCIWEETGGGALLNLYSTNFVTGDPEVLINDSSDPAGVVKAWYPIVCKSSSSATGPYSVAATATNSVASVDIVGSDCGPTVVGQMVTGGTFTVPISGTARFYCLDGPRTTKITNISKGVSNVVITYQVR